jgi:hypothetical protein
MVRNEKNLKTICNEMIEMAQVFYSYTEEICYKINKAVEVIGTFPIQEAFIRFINFIEIVIDQFDDVTKNAYKELLKRGWYITTSFPLKYFLNLNNLSDEEIEEIMNNYARSEVVPTLEKINKYFPHRYNILCDAFKAHENGLFSLSIPVMLAQADGITNELFCVSFFKKK